MSKSSSTFQFKILSYYPILAVSFFQTSLSKKMAGFVKQTPPAKWLLFPIFLEKNILSASFLLSNSASVRFRCLLHLAQQGRLRSNSGTTSKASTISLTQLQCRTRSEHSLVVFLKLMSHRYMERHIHWIRWLLNLNLATNWLKMAT